MDQTVLECLELLIEVAPRKETDAMLRKCVQLTIQMHLEEKLSPLQL